MSNVISFKTLKKRVVARPSAQAVNDLDEAIADAVDAVWDACGALRQALRDANALNATEFEGVLADDAYSVLGGIDDLNDVVSVLNAIATNPQTKKPVGY